MIPTERPLDNPINWSFRLARVRSIDIRVHIAFLLAAVVVVWMQLPPHGSDQPWHLSQALIDGLGLYGMLFALVLLHELGHCYGARKTGGTADEVLLWPLGGLAFVRPPHQPAAHLVTAMAGPTVNVLVCALCCGAITAWTGHIGAVPWNPLHPFQPVDPLVFPSPAQTWLVRLFGVSYFLLLVNLLPIFPFDGGRLLQSWLWSRKGYRRSMELATGTGMIAAIAVGVFGLFLAEGWLILLIAVFGYLTCWQDRRRIRENEFDIAGLGYEYGGFGEHSHAGDDLRSASDQSRRTGYLAARRVQRAVLREEKERAEHERRQQQVESILRKISASGLGSLTARERRILEAETRRCRMAGREASSD